MKKYPCADCKVEFDPHSLWVCPDDKLRCGGCLIKREFSLLPAAYRVPAEVIAKQGRN